MVTSSSPAIEPEPGTFADIHQVAAGPLRLRILRAILWSGLVAGVLDISYVIIIFGLVRGTSPVRILQGIAGGLLGPAAVTGGFATAALGLVCHFTIAYGAATTYALTALRLPLLIRRPLFSGVIFGTCVYIFMQAVVLPLSRIGGSVPRFTWPTVVVFIAHLICVGIPIALLTRRAYTSN